MILFLFFILFVVKNFEFKHKIIFTVKLLFIDIIVFKVSNFIKKSKVLII